MIRSLYTAATGMDAQQTRMDTIANNLANANTTGFKKSTANFEDLLYETLTSPKEATTQGAPAPIPLQVGLGVKTASVTRGFSEGDALRTDAPLDLMIGGQGFFRVQRANGELAYTRDGKFTVGADGRISTAAGLVLEPGISVPPTTKQLTISKDGVVTAQLADVTQPVELGRIELAMFTNPAGLEAAGGNLYVETVASGTPLVTRADEQGAGSLNQGYVEGSNVKAVEEMVAMITTQRSYELNSKVIQTADQMLQKLTNLR